MTGEPRIDVLVIGAGGSGLAAAIEAAASGASVCVLEKNAHIGGTTRLSVGSITATGTPHQARAGITDSPDSHATDMALINSRRKSSDNDELRQLLTQEMPVTFQWLLDLGLEFIGPFPEAPHTQPRMHCVLPTARAYIDRLERKARALDVRVLCQHRVDSLIFGEGRVIGAIALDDRGQAISFLAEATILASGDFSGNAEMVAKYIGDGAARARPINPSNTGDGHRMAQALGGQVLNSDIALLSLRFLPPERAPLVQKLPPTRWMARLMRMGYERLPTGLVRPLLMAFITSALQPVRAVYDAGAILVDDKGRRLDEGQIGAPGVASTAWLILDQRVVHQFSAWPNFVSTAPGVGYAYMQDYRRHRPDLWHGARSLDKLAELIEVSATELKKSIAAFHMDESSQRGGGITQSPFVALGPLSTVLVFTDGGLRIDTSMRVIDGTGLPIKGLYAVGATGQGGMMLDGHGHHIGWAFTSGRLGGINASAYSRSQVK
ncbi:MAG: FAD-dependent oxidoreductase [Pigmentiphaga sp.]